MIPLSLAWCTPKMVCPQHLNAAVVWYGPPWIDFQ
jgi:hypothetical protein